MRAPDRPEGPPGPQSLATLLIGLRLATTLRHWSFASGISEVDVFVLQPMAWGGGGYIGVQGRFPHTGSGGSE
jgi:hypothetical protein